MKNMSLIKKELIVKIKEKLDRILSNVESDTLVEDKKHEIFLLVTINEELEDVLMNWTNDDPNSTLNYFRNKHISFDDDLDDF
jgi:hypothetical protein